MRGEEHKTSTLAGTDVFNDTGRDALSGTLRRPPPAKVFRRENARFQVLVAYPSKKCRNGSTFYGYSNDGSDL